MKKLLAGLLLVGGLVHADPLVWNTQYGTIGLPLTATEAGLGYDGILKQAIGIASVPVYTDPKNIIALQIGASTPWPVQGTAVEPYFGAGHDLAREIPILAQYSSLHVNVFGRYASTQGKAGAGISVSWAPGTALLPSPIPAGSPPPSVPKTSKLNLSIPYS